MSNSKFFTNEPEKDLYTRFSKILQSNTQFFDILVGYFRSSGFFRMKDALEDVEKIRVLVGLNVDKYTVKIIDQANEEIDYERKTINEGKEIISESVAEEFAKVDESENVESGVRTFVDWLKSGKMEMRMFTEEPLHAKVYIMREPENSAYKGCVITGSSNFSESGLKGNREFNVELRDDDDVDFALTQFEELWKLGVPIDETYVDAIQQKTWLKDDVTPYEVYLKVLYEFFKGEINADSEATRGIDPPDGFMTLQYQVDAVQQAKSTLEAYNGVFISDVVGLGKTYIAAMLMQILKGKKLVICPPVLKEYWEDVLMDFGVSAKVESLGKLQKVIDRGISDYQYVFIDEAHRFRHDDTEAYKLLHQICFGKKVVLISATPINNYTSDIANQIFLFQTPKASNICPGLKNLEKYFGKLQGKVKKIDKDDKEGRLAQLRENSEDIRDKLLRKIMIRRTREEIMEYYADDLERQGLTFPKADNPIPLEYQFDAQLNKIFNDTMAEIKDFGYARYMPLVYLKDKKKYATEIIGQRNMGGFMKGVLVKRLESSFYAFNKSLDRFLESYRNFIKMYESGTVYISKKVNVYELLDNGDDDKLMELADMPDDKVRKFRSDEFDESFIKDLRSDYEQLLMMKAEWKTVVEDPKLTAFIDTLRTDERLKGKKVIVFTESKETADYLEANISKISDRTVRFSGESSEKLKLEIEKSFNPKYADEGEDKYDILITTDVLAEGVNLHLAGSLINYDLPWNPTKMMQRVGRINRVGSPHEEIHVFNFFPTEESSEQIPLKQRILEKLQAFHDTLGNDIAYLCDEEDVSSQKIFEQMTTLEDEEEGTNPELKYLGVIRQVRDNDTELYEKIKNMPLKVKVGRNSEVNGTISMIRQGSYKTFFLTTEEGTKQLTFMEAIKLIETSKDEKPVKIGKDYYKEIATNRKAFDDALVEEEIVGENTQATRGTKGNDTKVINLLQAAKQGRRLTDEEELQANRLIAVLQTGEIPTRITKDILKDIKKAKDELEVYHIINESIPETYYEERTPSKIKIDGEKQVIVSESLVK